MAKVSYARGIAGENMAVDAFNLALAATRDDWRMAGHVVNGQPDGQLFGLLCTLVGLFRAVVAGLDERDRDAWFWAARWAALDAAADGRNGPDKTRAELSIVTDTPDNDDPSWQTMVYTYVNRKECGAYYRRLHTDKSFAVLMSRRQKSLTYLYDAPQSKSVRRQRGCSVGR